MACLVASQSSSFRDLPGPHAPVSGPINTCGQCRPDPSVTGYWPCGAQLPRLELDAPVVVGGVGEVPEVARGLHTQDFSRPIRPRPNSDRGNLYTNDSSGHKESGLTVVGAVAEMLLSLCPCL